MTHDERTAAPGRSPRREHPRAGALTPLEIDTDDALGFVTRFLPRPPASLLEIGCGDGRLAVKLQARGYRVEAIDSDAEAVAAAREKGVDARHVGLLDFAGGPFDAVLLTRSLHHIWPLDAAVARARSLTAPGGVVVVDELSLDEVDDASARWFYDVLAMLDDAGALSTHPTWAHHQHHGHQHQHHVDEAKAASALDIWKQSHAHDPPLHGAQAMREALGAAFDIECVERAAHLHRLFAGRLRPDERGAHLMEGVRCLEEAFIAAGLVLPLGLRIVGRRG